MKSHLRHIPSMDICLRALRDRYPDFQQIPQHLLRDIVNEYWNKKRKEIANAENVTADSLAIENQLPHLARYVGVFLQPNLCQVLNATGVIIHTNLGRSVLAEKAAKAVALAAGNYCNLELNLATGERGSRHAITEDLLRRLAGCEAAMVVNNNAAAVLLILDSLCSGGEVIVSRGELVEIGGSFRIPEIMAKSGAILREVGATNKTHYNDYKNAINENTRAIMCVHASNFRIVGFHESVPLGKLKKLAHEHNLPLIMDLGSGSLIDFTLYSSLPPEPLVRQTISEGADIVSFSGDKALGGPQAGIIAGRKELLDKCRRNQLARALRCDKLCIAALEATLRIYLDPQKALKEIPTAMMMSMSLKEITSNAHSLCRMIKKKLKGNELEITCCHDVSRVGGGAFPECDLPTTLVCLHPMELSAQQLRTRLLHSTPPLLGRLEKDAFCLDPRTLLKSQYREVANAIAAAVTSTS